MLVRKSTPAITVTVRNMLARAEVLSWTLPRRGLCRRESQLALNGEIT